MTLRRRLPYPLLAAATVAVLGGALYLALTQADVRREASGVSPSDGAPLAAGVSPPSAGTDASRLTPENSRANAIDAAVQAAVEAVKQRLGDAGACTALAVAYMRKQRDSGDPAYYGRAEHALQRALDLAPDDYEASKTLAWVRMGQHRFREARRLAARCAQRNPQDPWNHGVIGDACAELGEYGAAVEAIQRMVNLRPGLTAYARIAHLRELHGEHEGALQMMRMAAESAGAADTENAAWCWTQLGDLSFNGWKLPEARRHYDMALLYRPGYYLALAGKARIAAAERKLDEAEQLLTQAIAVLPRPDFLAALGDVYALAGKEEQARKQYDLVVQVEQANRAAGAPDNRHLALFYVNHDRDLDQALSLAQREYADRQDIYTCDALAWALYKNGRFPEAWKLSQRALRLKTKDALLLYHAGMIARRLPGQTAQAQRLLERALALNPYFDLREAPKARRTLAALKDGGPRRVARSGA